jgi:hypothetical protein
MAQRVWLGRHTHAVVNVFSHVPCTEATTQPFEASLWSTVLCLAFSLSPAGGSRLPLRRYHPSVNKRHCEEQTHRQKLTARIARRCSHPARERERHHVTTQYTDVGLHSTFTQACQHANTQLTATAIATSPPAPPGAGYVRLRLPVQVVTSPAVANLPPRSPQRAS